LQATSCRAPAIVAVEKRSLLRRVTRDAIELEDRFTGELRRLRVLALVDAGYRLPDDDLWRETGERLPRAGDAVAPRSIYEAILEGRRAALALERAPRKAGGAVVGMT
jgi:hypothetical protein